MEEKLKEMSIEELRETKYMIEHILTEKSVNEWRSKIQKLIDECPFAIFDKDEGYISKAEIKDDDGFIEIRLT